MISSFCLLPAKFRNTGNSKPKRSSFLGAEQWNPGISAVIKMYDENDKVPHEHWFDAVTLYEYLNRSDMAT